MITSTKRYLYLLSLSAVAFLNLLPTSLAQTACTVNQPTDRSFYDLVGINNNKVFLLGGSLNETQVDMWSLDLSGQLNATCAPWTKIQVSIQNGSGFGPYLYGVAFTSTVNNNNNNIYIHGGDTPETAMGLQQQPYFYNVNLNSVGPTAPDAVMTPRSSMTATVDTSNNKVWIFGGRQPFPFGKEGALSQTYNDLYYYQFNAAPSSVTIKKTDVISHYGPPASRYGHTTTLIQSKLFALGGYVRHNDTSATMIDFASAFVFDTATNQAVAMETLGDIPSPRSEFSAVAAQDGRSIIIFGGRLLDNFRTVTNEVAILDTCTLTWKKQYINNHAGARAAHRAYMYGKYMITMLGISGHNGNTQPVFSNDMVILDTDTWSWVTLIPAGYSPSTASPSPSCSFTFPATPTEQQNIGTAPKAYDSSVIKNPNAPQPQLSEPQKGGIGVGVPLFIIACLGAAFYFYRRRQRNKSRQLNPRWMPGALSSGNNDNSHQQTTSGRNDYPLFTYNNNKENENASTTGPPGGGGGGLRSYTATDHDQWERQLIQDTERPQADDKPMARHEDIWSRMRGLHAPGDEERR